MQNIISAFINGALSAYMTEVKSNSIGGSLAHKNLKIAELEVFPDALLQHGLPILIKKGFIKNVDIQAPDKITTEPIIITIESVTILGSIYSRHPTPSEMINMKIRLLKAYKYFRKRYKLLLGFLQKDSFISLFRSIMSNVIVEVKQIHIRIEYSSKISLDLSDPDSPTISTKPPPSPPPNQKYTNIVYYQPPEEDEDDKKAKTKHSILKKGKGNSDDDYSTEEDSGSSADDDVVSPNRFSMYEDLYLGKENPEEKVTAIGVTMKKLILHNPADYEVTQNTHIVKEVVFTDLAVYFDVGQTPVNSKSKEQCLSQMDNLFNSTDHNWMLPPFSFRSLVKFEKDNPALLIEPIMKEILVNIREEYIPLMLEFVKAFDTFRKVISVAHIPKSSPEYPQYFWHYIHNCALTKISNASYDFTTSLNLLVKRAIFIRNYKKKNDRSLAIIKEMEETLDYSTIVAFRAAYRLSHKKKKPKGKSKITSRTTQKIINTMKVDPVYMITAMIDMLSINMKGELVKIALSRNPGKKHIVVKVKKPHMVFEKDLKSYQLHATISYVCVLYKNGKEKSVVFKSVDNTQSEMKVDMMVPFHSYSNWSAALNVSKNNYTVNMLSLFKIATDLSRLKFVESSMNTENIIAFFKRRKFELNVDIHSSVIKIVGSKSNRAIQYAFDELSFATDTKTLERTLKLSNSWISFVTNSETKVSSDFSIFGKMVGKKVDITIPLFSCTIPFKYIVVIQDFVNIFLQYQDLFRIEAFPKIDIDFKLDMKGFDINLNLPKMKKKKSLQIRKIKLKFRKSVFNFKLSSIKMSRLFKLRDLKARFDKKSLDVKLKFISAKIIDLIELIPKDALQQIQNQNTLPPPTTPEKDDQSDSSDTETKSSEISEMKSDKSIELPKLKIGFLVSQCKIDLRIAEDECVKFRISEIKASMRKNKIAASALLDKIKIGSEIIAKQIQYESEVTFDQIIEIFVKTDNCNLDIDKDVIRLLLGLKFQTPQIVLPHDIAMKLSFVMKQMSISNEFKMSNFKADVKIINSKVEGSVGMDSVDSSFVKFKSKDIVKLNADINEKTIDLKINLKEITIFVIPLIDVLSMFPLDLPKTDPPNINMNIKAKPIGCNLCFGEDILNIMINSPLKLVVNTLKRKIPYVNMQMNDFLILLNNAEMVSVKSLDFIFDKNIDIEIPSINVIVSMVKMYKLFKMISIILSIPFVNTPQKTVAINNVPIEQIKCRVPLISLLMQQTKSKRNISLDFENTEFYLKNSQEKAELFGETHAKFTASDGFLSFELTPHFKITCSGEISDTKKACALEIKDPIKFEFTAFTINQILKNLTATEDDAENQYSISNETGAEISIIINKDEYKLKSTENLPNITNFAESDIKVKIGDITNPFQLYSSYSKISTPLYFDKNFILVWMDTKKLQLRLLSPIAFKNKSNIDLEVQVNNTCFTLKDGDIYYLDYTMQYVDSMLVKYNGDHQQVHLADSSVIRLNDKFIVVSRKRKVETLRTTISFNAPYYFRNELVSNIVISIQGEKKDKTHQVHIKPYQVVPIPFFLPALQIISFDIMENKNIKTTHVDLNLEDIKDKRYFVTARDKKGKEFILQFSLNNIKMNIISISPFLIYYNSLAIPLVFGLSPEEKIPHRKTLNFEGDLSEIFPYSNSQNIWRINNPVMVSPKIEDAKDLQIYIASRYSKHWSPDSISISNFDSSSDLKIPLTHGTVSLARYHALSNSNLQPNTFIFFISPKYVFNNQTNETFALDLFKGDPIEILPNSTIPVTLIRKSLQFSVAVVPKTKKHHKKHGLVYSNRLDIEKINSQFTSVSNVESPILFQTSVEKDVKFITIMLNRSLPYMFVNKTDLKVIFIQKDTGDSAHTVMPNESLPFYLYDENMPTIIFCEIRNEIKFELDVNKPSFPVEINCKQEDKELNLYYYVDLSAIEGSVITLVNVTDDEINIPVASGLNSKESHLGLTSPNDESSISVSLADLSRMKNDAINFSCDISQISLMIITGKYQELCNITLKDILINSTISGFETKTQASIGLIKVDDQNKYAVYPSVFQILPSSTRPAFLFTVSSFGNRKYGKIEFEVRPINIQVDLSFISDLIGDIFYFENNNISKNSDDDDDNEDDQSDSNEDNNSDNVESVGRKHFQFKMSELPLTEIMHNIMPKQTKYHINNILIHPFIIHITFHTTTTRSYHPLQNKYEINRLVNFIPSFNNVVISIDDEHSFRNLSGTTDEIVFMISHEVKTMILNQLSLKSNILGTKRMIVKAFKSLFKPETASNATKGIINKTTLVLSVAESTLCYFSSMLDIYTGAPPNIRTDVTSYEALHWGVKSLTSSFSEGAKELISEPRERGNVNGRTDYCGYLVGTGVGISKCAAHIASGMCSFGASLFSGTRRLFFTEKIVFIDKRECEPILGMHCDEKDHILWYTGSIATCLIEVYTHSIYISNGDIFIQNFAKAEIDKNKVIIYDVNQNKYKTKFDNDNQAIAFYSIVESQLLRRKLLDIPAPETMDDNL